ncbi:hypothetical protein NDU88_007527 [Pleurodeles waltl]|uniref:Uncharacterized protein n=1 Tax=Pleurodeles waltl TaxID=8319 RepID=A0AAV7NTU8_PLEWA|nr:hypothetical protein NDU88_007527 [Pleurodeles waltl]
MEHIAVWIDFFLRTTRAPRPAVPLWHMRPELLGDPEYRRDIQEALTGYFGGNWTTAQSRGIEWEALKVMRRGESLTKAYGIRKKLDLELTQKEDTLGALQHQIANGGALEAESQVVRARIGALWGRLDSYVHKDFRQLLHHEGDRSGCLLTWLLRRECPIPMILSLRGPAGGRILGQTRVNTHLREHLEELYSSPRCDMSSQIREYLDGLWLPRLIDAQVAELEAELSLEDLQGALCGMASGKAPGPDGLAVELHFCISGNSAEDVMQTSAY